MNIRFDYAGSVIVIVHRDASIPTHAHYGSLSACGISWPAGSTIRTLAQVDCFWCILGKGYYA